MIKKHYVITFLFLLIPLYMLRAQVEDDFSDGNFTENPVWTGDRELFIINDNFQLQLNDEDAGQAVLATQSRVIHNAEWRFWIRMAFAPSNNNYAQIYLAADKPDLRQPLNGYFLRFGEGGSNDAIELYRQEGEVKTLICRGTDGDINASFFAGIKVVYQDNIWRIFSDMMGGNFFQEIASGNDIVSFESEYLGIFCEYTKSNAKRFYFDDFYAGAIYVDTEPPEIESAEIISENEIKIVFSEPVTVESAQNTGNYKLSPGDFLPKNASLEADNRTVSLTFDTSVAPRTEYLLTIRNIADVQGNVADVLQETVFCYVALPYDILITEIMARSSPSVGLPEASYVELYNNTDYAINLNKWSLIIGSSTKNFGDYVLDKEEYLILCHNNNKELLAQYGRCYGFSSFSLTYGGTALTLYGPEQEQIVHVRYSDTWYRDDFKKNGGWSLERIDLSNHCDHSDNWTASVASNGGTPGKQNSVSGTNTETILPELLYAKYIDTYTIEVFFNKNMNPATLSDVSIWEADNELGIPENVNVVAPDYTSVILSFSGAIEKEIIYTLQLKRENVCDCAGLSLSGSAEVRFSEPLQAKEYDVLITEIMARPTPAIGLPDAVYVELYNNSRFPVNLKGWSLDIGSSSKTFDDFVFDQGEYLILCHDNNKNALSLYGKCYGFSSFSLTYGGMPLTLYNAMHEQISHVRYSDTWYKDDLKKEGGWSLERIDLSNHCDHIDNWTASKAPQGGTPGMQNSVWGINEETVTPQLLYANYIDRYAVEVFFNKSMNPATLSDVSIWNADNGLGNPVSVLPIAPDYKSVVLTFSEEMQTATVYTLTLKQEAIRDCAEIPLHGDSEVRFAIPVEAEKLDILINEVMFSPNSVQYVELFNHSGQAFDIKSLRFIFENNKGEQKTCAIPSFLLLPDGYAVLTKQAKNVLSSYKSEVKTFIEIDNFPTLGAGEGTVRIAKAADSTQIIDVMRYNSKMHSPIISSVSGISLERISPERSSTDETNWHSAAETAGFGTPGYRNSQFDNGESDRTITIDPEIFTPNNDGIDDYLSIRYKFDEPGYIANVYIYNSSGKFVKRVANNVTIGTEGAFTWDGRDENNQLAGAGIYVVLMDIFNLQGKTKRYKKAATLGVRL